MKSISYPPSTPCWTVLLLLVLLAGAPAGRAQAPAWQTAVALGSLYGGGANNYSVLAMASDAAGNLYLAGVFNGTIGFGGTTLTSTNASPNTPDGFIAKWNQPTSSFVWVQRLAQAGSSSRGIVYPTAVAVVGPSVYVAGFLNGGVQFGAINLPPGNGTDLFVARLTDAGTSGSFAWARRAGGTTPTAFISSVNMAVNGANVYVAGAFKGTVGFGSTTLSGGSSSFDTYVAKVTDAGTATAFTWALTETVPAGSSGYSEIRGVAVRGSSVYVAGIFGGATAQFGPAILTQAGGAGGRGDGFMAQLTDAGSTGSYTAAQRAGGTGGDGFDALAVTGTGVYATGKFDNGFPLTFGTVSVPPPANGSLLAKWDPATGNFGWVQAAPGANSSTNANAVEFNRIVASGAALYLVGTVQNAATDRDAALAKYTDAGSGATLNWSTRGGNSGDDQAYLLALGGSRVCVFSASNSATVVFGSLSVPNAYYQAGNPNQSYGGFLTTLTDPTLTATRPALTGTPLALYPNPAHGTATMRRPGGAPTTLTLTDALGREVRRYPVPAGAAETALDLHGLPTGCYQLREGAGGQKLLIE